MRALGTAVGTVLLTAIYEIKLDQFQPQYISAVAINAGLPAVDISTFITGTVTSNSTLLYGIPGISASLVAAGASASLDAYTKALHYGWYTVYPFILVAMLGESLTSCN